MQLHCSKINAIAVPSNPNDRNQYEISLPDPDVNSFVIRVEIKSLEMDNVRSENGKEAYYIWKEKEFKIPFDATTENYDLEANIQIKYQDFNQIIPNDDDEKNILILPTSRELRLTFIPLVEGAAENESVEANYASHFVREGRPIILTSFKEAKIETELLSEIKGGLRAFYLQPEDKPELSSLSKIKLDFTKLSENPTSIELKRLAEALNLTSHHLTLEGNKGERVQFGLSNEIRHSLSPESGSVTFSSVKELFNRWIMAFDYSLLRDWSWQGLQEDSFTIYRKVIDVDEIEIEVGSIQLKDVANMSMLSDSLREQSRVIFLDCIDPEKYRKNYPRELSVEYRIVPNFRKGYEETEIEKYCSLTVDLPITSIPHQIPKLVSAGVALSPYEYDTENYKYSVERQKYLWFEFEDTPLDPNDTYFVRVLAYSPDPYLCKIDDKYISNIQPDLPFILNDEKIREIIPKMTNDNAGIGVMQELIPESKENSKSYLLPLPNGLHSNSDELFGFFTYEIRIGHKKEFWSTAQARFGRPLKAQGVQHPAPELNCTVYRSEDKELLGNEKYIEIAAIHANAVSEGQIITAYPPNTSLWYLLYAQVMQADGKSYRNLLIDSGAMPFKPKKSEIRNNKNLTNKMGIAKVSVKEIGNKLQQLGLPKSNNISALTVEMFPLNNKWQYKKPLRHEGYSEEIKIKGNPLTDLLGQYRIYRTSKLTSITEVCCEEC